jgi:Alpha/beta hydrolase domain
MQNRIELRIADRRPFADGQAFGPHGPYERLKGRAHLAVDPAAPAQAGITDLEKAPVNADGLVEFASDVLILTPADPEKGNRRLFHDWGNRGNCRALQFFNDAVHSNDPLTPAHAGNGFLFRRGYSFVWSAWQGDLLPGNGRATMDLPVATDNDRPLSGLVRQEFVPARVTQSYPLSGRASTRSHPTVSRDTARARLTRRRYPWDERQPIPAEAWRFAQLQSGEAISGEGGTGEVGLAASDTHIYLEGGFQPGWIYELVYEGRDPLVLGLGHVAVRELVAYLKYGAEDAAGNPNPVGRIEKAYGWGRSQTGRCIRDFIYNGFNADARGRKVFDGLLPHVAGAGMMWMNHRFANVVSAAGQQYEDHFNIADRFPFAYAGSTDHLTGRTDAILNRPETDPLVLHSQTATEYWQRRGSLVHTDSQGNDLEPPAGARVYLWASSQHFANPQLGAPAKGVCQNFVNVVQTSMLFRALLDAMDRWASDGTPPPASRIPRRADGTLATHAEWQEQFPKIPGVALSQGPAGLPLLDFGLDNGVLTKEPPEVLDREGYTVLVPAVDGDGNDRAGVRAPMVAAPLGTYTGWNLRGPGHGQGANHEFTGSYIPFADSAEERRFAGDPRPAVLERYATPEAYAEAIEAAARELVAEGLMLEEDVERARALARDWGRPRHVVAL